MHVVLAWFSARALTSESRAALRARFESSIRGLVPDSYARYEVGGDDWGVTMLHPGRNPSSRWDSVVADDRFTGLSLGVPVGAPRGETALTMARKLLAGEQIHRELVPPFGLIAIDREGEFAAQQDWLGQCRLFTGEADGITVLCSRPSLLSTVLHGKAEPDLDGWASYALVGHFGGDLSPIRGVRLLAPGERMTGRRENGRWEITSRTEFNVDDVVAAGLAQQGRPLEESLEVATEKFTAVAGHIWDQYDDIVLGLSGGKDSRTIAAALVAAGRVPRFNTNNDLPAEGETAAELVRILRESRNLDVEHSIQLAAAPANVFAYGLRDRVERLQQRYDYQFPYSYVVRPALGPLLPEKPAGASITGAGGELSSGYLYGNTDDQSESDELFALNRLVSDVAGIDPAAVERERERVLAVLKRGKGIGLEGHHLLDYLYLVERHRRWFSSAYSLNMITPLLHPAMVEVTFSLSTEAKRDRILHSNLTERLVPEWAGIPYVTFSTKSSIPHIWHGDGTKVIADLIDTADGQIAQLLDRKVVEELLITRTGPARKTLQRFAYMAVASQHLEPDSVRPTTNETYARVIATRKANAPKPPKPQPKPLSTRQKITSRLRWIKRLPGGERAWNFAKTQLRKPKTT